MLLLFPLLVVLVTVSALLLPAYFLWTLPCIVPLLGLIMFSMGVTLRPHDFREVLRAPKVVLLGLAAQYVIMAGVAYLLVRFLQLPPGIAIGVILVGSCPGGTASNLLSYIAGGDVALSVSLTACSTLCSPLLTPLLTLLLAGESFTVDYLGMFKSIITIVVLPVVLGMLVNMFKQRLGWILRVMPVLAMGAILIIIAGIVAKNSANLRSIALVAIIAVILHNLCGLAAGYLLGRSCGFSYRQRRTLALEVGLQNSGLAATLAKNFFASTPEAMIPAAFFSVWHNISGAVLATYWSRCDRKRESEAESSR